MLIYIIIPAWNEARRISRVVQELIAHTRHLPGEWRILVIDDGSMDDTGSVASHAGAYVVSHSINRGQGAALRTGNAYAYRCGAHAVIHFDADGQHDVTNIFSLIDPIVNQNIDVVLGSRFSDSVSPDTVPYAPSEFSVLIRLARAITKLMKTRRIPLLRRVLLGGSLCINTVFTGVVLSDVHNGLRAFTRAAVSRLDLSHDRMAHSTEYIQEIRRLGLSYIEVPIVVHYDLDKKSQGFFDGIKILRQLTLGKFVK